MKKLVIILMAMMTTGFAFAQKSKVVSAYNYLRNQQIKEAHEAIEPTIEHHKTKDDAKTWFYRGNVYLAILMSDDPEVTALSDNPLKVAEDSYNKALELDEKGRYKDMIMERIPFIAEQYYNQGVQSYNGKNYEEAMKNFARAREIKAELGTVDSLALFNAALCAELSENYDKAKTYYRDLIEMKYEGDPNAVPVYVSMSRIYKAEGDTAKAVEIIREGLLRYPGEFDLIIEETNIHLASGNIVAAQENLEKAIQMDSTNPTIFFAVGTTYDQMGDKEKAISAYKNAVELKPDYFDANYNLGALFVNEAAAIIEEANKLPLGDPKYDEEKAKADAMLLEALPYLENANKIDPTDLYTLNTLKEIYARTNQLEKLKKVNEAIQQQKQ